MIWTKEERKEGREEERKEEWKKEWKGFDIGLSLSPLVLSKSLLVRSRFCIFGLYVSWLGRWVCRWLVGWLGGWLGGWLVG